MRCRGDKSKYELIMKLGIHSEPDDDGIDVKGPPSEQRTVDYLRI
jgi:hypothetical protein